MGKDWARVLFLQGEVVGECEFVEDRPTWKLQRMAIFKCLQPDCGKEFISPVRLVKEGRTVSCGCLKHRTIKKAAAVRRTHGMTTHPMYKRWSQIKTRCFNKNNNQYPDYGGRGIVMCEEWKDDFKAFYDYITQLDGYDEKLLNGREITLDRRNNNRGYEPGNMRWADQHTQTLNQRKRKNKIGEFDGVYKIYAATGVKYASNITVNGDKNWLGTHPTPEAAAMERDMFIIKNGLWEYPLQAVRSN